MDSVCRHVLTKVLALNTEEHLLMLTEVPFNSPAVILRCISTCSSVIYALGRTMCIVIHPGNDFTHVVSIYADLHIAA